MSQFAFGAKGFAVKDGDPLPSARRHIEIADRGRDLGRDVVPVELGILEHDVRRHLIAKLLVEADFLKLGEHGVWSTAQLERKWTVVEVLCSRGSSSGQDQFQAAGN